MRKGAIAEPIAEATTIAPRKSMLFADKVLPERVNRGQCSFEKVLKHGTAARREKSEFLFGYARFLQQRDGVTASEDFLRVAFRYELRYRDRIAGIAVFVESRRAVPDDEARGGDNGG